MTARRLISSEVDRIIDQKRREAMLAAGLPRCSGYGCEQGRSACNCPTSGASAVSGIEDEPPYNQSTKPRLGRLSLTERVLLTRRPSYLGAVLLAVVCVAVITWGRT